MEELNFNKEQETAIFSEKPLVVISAGAGSGKTRVLTERYIHICEQKLQEKLGNRTSSSIGATVEEIVAITFTEKAAREMKDRIRGRIENKRATVENHYLEKDVKLARNFWQEQKEALDGALITTFHSFCHKLLHEYAFEADMVPSFSVLDDVQAKLIQIDIFEDMFDSPEFHREWRPIYHYYTRNQLKEAIKAVYSQMKEIITSVDSIETFFNSDEIVQLQLATIENDRKSALTHFYEQARPYVMELEDSEKVSKKIIEHFATVSDLSFAEPITVYSELESAMPKKISKSWQESNPSLFELYEHFYKPLKEAWKKLKGPTEAEIEEIKEIIKLFAQMLAVLHEKYDEAKRERAALDFSDLQQKAIALLENESVQHACRNKYKHMMVDEFQDTNQLQMNMLTFIQPSYQFVVGDGKQSIYRFRGADVSLMKELVDFSKKDENSEFINMSTNYRTCDSIIQFVNLSFQEIMGVEDDALDPSYKINYTKINSHRNSRDEMEGRVELITVPPEDDSEEEEEKRKIPSEYEVITNRMLEMMEEKKEIVAEEDHWRAPEWRDFAILIQARTKLTKLEKALKDKRIPYVVYGGIGFYEKQEVRDMLTLIEWINRPWESLYILSLLRSPLFGVTVEGFLTIDECLEEETTLASYIYEGLFLEDASIDDDLKNSLKKLKRFYEEWVPYTPQTSIQTYLNELFSQSGLKAMLLLQRNNIQLVKNVEKLIDVLAQFQTASLDDLLEQVKQLAALSEKEGEAEVELAEGNMVHIMTVHASKGLEFPIVFLPDLAKGARGDSGSIRFDKDVRVVVEYEKEKEDDPLKKPAKKSSPSFETIKAQAKNQASEEAKRLFYVAVTRAKDYLVLSTVDKATNDSWYDMLQKALEQNSLLNDYLIERSKIDEYEKWEETDEVYEPPTMIERSTLPVSCSVSEIMTFMNDPLKYYYKYIVKAEDLWLSDEQESRPIENDELYTSGATLGSIVHRACELIDNGYSLDEAKEDALSILEDVFEQKRYEQPLDELVVNFRQLDEFQLGQHVANEWAFTVEIEGVEIIGEIDKIVKKDGQYHLIDLKTNKGENYDLLTSYYTPQLYLYKLAFEKAYGQKVNQMSLFFMRAGKKGFKTIIFDEAVENEVREVIKKLAHLKRNSVTKLDFIK